MSESLSWLGSACMALAFFAVLAGVGFWRLAVAMIVSLAVAAAAAGLVGWIVFSISMRIEHGGGEWAGLASLVIAVIATLVVFLVTFVVTMIVLAFSRFSIFRRDRMSWPLWVGGAGLFVAGCCILLLSTPPYASTEQLVERLEVVVWNQEIEDELARRGTEAIPILVAETRRHPDNGDDGVQHQLPPLLRMLGRIGGPDANAELLRWAKSQAGPSVRVAALCALGESGDREAVPLIAATLAGTDSDCNYDRASLLRALGKLKAADQVATIANAITAQEPFAQGSTITAGVAALVAIDTDEAWAAIATLSTDPDAVRRQQIVAALAEFPGAQTSPILVAILEDSDLRVCEAAFWSLLRVEPRLRDTIPSEWNEANAEKMRQAIKALAPANP